MSETMADIREYLEAQRPRDWSRAEIVAWCEENGKNPALFLTPEPPENPEPGLYERMTADMDHKMVPSFGLPARDGELVITGGPTCATATRAEADAALCDLFIGLSAAITRHGCEVDISDPRRIVVRRGLKQNPEPIQVERMLEPAADPTARSEADPLPSNGVGVAGTSTGEPSAPESHSEQARTVDKGAE